MFAHMSFYVSLYYFIFSYLHSIKMYLKLAMSLHELVLIGIKNTSLVETYHGAFMKQLELSDDYFIMVMKILDMLFLVPC